MAERNIFLCYGCLKNKTENNPIMLSRNHGLTKLVEFKYHEKVFYNGVKQTLNEFRNEFWINRGRYYFLRLPNICFIRKRSQARSYSYPEKSDLPGYRGNRIVPFQVCDVDYLGPVFVTDIYFRCIKLTFLFIYLFIYLINSFRAGTILVETNKNQPTN